MTRAFDHINATALLRLVEEMPDHLPTLKQKWDRTGGTTMPSSPLVDQYRLTTNYVPYTIADDGSMMVKGKLVYSTEVEWAKHVPTLMHLIDPQQIWHRSRDVAVAVDTLRINEINRRIEQVQEWYPDYKKYSLSTSESYEIAQIVRDETRRALHVNYEWIKSYIHEHIRSSLGDGGFK